MKKFWLSTFIIASFIIYSFIVRFNPKGNGASNDSSVAASTLPPSNQTTDSNYKDGQFTGGSADAYYGNVQVKATIQGGRIVNVQFLDYPHDRQTSANINSQAMPELKSEAIQAQSAKVDIVSGATDTSQAFIQSLASALEKAQN